MKKINVLANWKFLKAKQSSLAQSRIQDKIITYLNIIIPSLLFVTLGLAIYEFGFKSFWENHQTINFWFRTILNIVLVLVGFRFVLEQFTEQKERARIFNLITFLFAILITYYVLPGKINNLNTNS